MKKGLIMEGGAMRGLFTAGVIDVMMENDIEYDGAIGVSAGAAFGCNYKSRQIGRVIRYNIDNCRNPEYCSFRSLIKTGNMFGAEYCYHKLPEELDLFDYETYEKNPMEFYIVCTDVESGNPVYYKSEKADRECLEWMRASASMPLASRIVEVGGYKLLDGGISDSIPIKYFESIGYNRNVVILTQPEDYVKGRNKLIPLMKTVLRKYPNVVDTIARRHEIYNETTEYIKKKEREGDILVIRPDEALPIKRVEHDADKMRNVYGLGRVVAMRRLEEIKEFLKRE